MRKVSHRGPGTDQGPSSRRQSRFCFKKLLKPARPQGASRGHGPFVLMPFPQPAIAATITPHAGQIPARKFSGVYPETGRKPVFRDRAWKACPGGSQRCGWRPRRGELAGAVPMEERHEMVGKRIISPRIASQRSPDSSVAVAKILLALPPGWSGRFSGHSRRGQSSGFVAIHRMPAGSSYRLVTRRLFNSVVLLSKSAKRRHRAVSR